VAIPMIAFIEGGMRIPMGMVTRDYFRAHRLAPTQCAPNMFRILGCVDALNERMGLNLTHHDVNWIYNLHHLNGQGYHLKSRYLKVRLIQCLPDSNKVLKKDFLILSREWHDGLLCPTREEKLGRVLGLNLQFQSYPLHFFSLTFIYPKISFDLHFANDFFVFVDGFADPHATVPNLNLVNQTSLDKILKAEVFVHIDSKLRATHLILDYIPISKKFLAPKCVIKARDPQLQRINIAAPSFLLSIPVPKGTLTTKPILEGIPKVAPPLQHATEEEATSSQPSSMEREEIIEVSDTEGSKDFEDDFEVFNRPLSPKASTGDLDPHFSQILDEMGIQFKPRSNLLDLIES